MYDVLQTIHVIAAVAWVGGGIFHTFASAQLAGAPPEALRRWYEVDQVAGNRYFAPAAITTLLAGIGMVLVSDLAWSEPFIGIGLGGVAVSIVLGAGFQERTGKELLAALDDGDQGRVEDLQERLRMLFWIELVVLLVVVWAMVARPG